MNEFTLKKAERKRAKLRIGISAPSGGGKTYSALLLARGLADSWDKIAVIDTENRSASLYSQFGDYQVIELEENFAPERYIAAIKACEDAGVQVIVIDSATHEWDGKGGCLEIVDKLGGKFSDWSKVTPRHRAFLESIINSKCDIITTTRRKQDYAMEQNEKGKYSVTKVGLKEVQREGFEYELTLTFDMTITHLAKASKDRTGLFSDKPEFIITEDTGKELKEWNSGGIPDPMNEPATEEQKEQIVTMCEEMGGTVNKLVNAGAMLPLNRITIAGADKAISALKIRKENEKNNPPKQNPPTENPGNIDHVPDAAKPDSPKVSEARLTRIRVMGKEDGMVDDEHLIKYLFDTYGIDFATVEEFTSMCENQAKHIVAKMVDRRVEIKEEQSETTQEEIKTTQKNDNLPTEESNLSTEDDKSSEKDNYVAPENCEKCGKKLLKAEKKYLNNKAHEFLDPNSEEFKTYKSLCSKCQKELGFN